MKKMMFAALSLMTMFAIAGGNGAAPAAAATPVPSVAPGCVVTCAGNPVPGLTIRECAQFCRGTCDILC